MDGDLFDMTTTEHPAALAGASFDYSALPKDLAEEAREVARRIVASQEQHIALAVQAGRELAAIKSRLDHGHWLPWLEMECRIDKRTAQRYMATAEAFGDKYDTVSYLPMSTVYKLASPKAEPIKTAIVTKIEAGERPTARDVENEIWQAQQDQKRKTKAETHQLRKARLARERRHDEKWLDEQDANDLRAAEMDDRAASLADMIMSRLTPEDIKRFESEYLPGFRLERAMEEWLNPKRREGRIRERGAQAAERRAKHERKWSKAK